MEATSTIAGGSGRSSLADRKAAARRPAGNRDVPVRRRYRHAWLPALAALLCLAQAGWIHAKAVLAQWLLERSWQARLTDGGTHAPWPWADTWAVARLHAPSLGIRQVVLAGDDGRALAFGPGWARASAAPGQRGTTVISGHRDTHFAWLAQLRAGDMLELETRDGRRRYQVRGTRIADSRHEHLTLDDDGDRLVLVTCWPFDAVPPGGPLRWVVEAQPLPPGG